MGKGPVIHPNIGRPHPPNKIVLNSKKSVLCHAYFNVSGHE